jgi:hypothetical protein
VDVHFKKSVCALKTIAPGNQTFMHWADVPAKELPANPVPPFPSKPLHQSKNAKQ